MNLEKWVRRRGYQYFGNVTNPDLIIVGEDHDKLDLKREQARLINCVEPEYVLHEYIPSHRVIRREDRKIYAPLIAQQYVKFIKCDLSDDESDRIFGSFYNLGLPSIAYHIYREEHAMAPIMLRFTKLATHQPTISILGAYHAHRESAIYPILDANRISYFVMLQAPEPRLDFKAARKRIISILEKRGDEEARKAMRLFIQQ